jgi:hypothetical protein
LLARRGARDSAVAACDQRPFTTPEFDEEAAMSSGDELQTNQTRDTAMAGDGPAVAVMMPRRLGALIVVLALAITAAGAFAQAPVCPRSRSRSWCPTG